MTVIIKGTQVLVKKGTTISTTKPGMQLKVAGRDQIVTVNHTLSGIRTNAHMFLYHVERYGMEVDPQELARAKSIIESNDITAYWELSFIEKKPSVVWAGTGGYWHEVDADQVTVV